MDEHIRAKRREQAQRAVLALAAAAMGLNGAWMMADPAAWYGATPGVAETGPLNLHFVRDVGAAFVTLAAGLALAIPPVAARFALVSVAATFSVLHALIHIGESLGPEGRPFLGQEALAILAPAFAAVAVAIWTRPRAGAKDRT